EHVEILRGFDRRRLNDRHGLAVSGQRAKSAGIFDRSDLLAGIAVIAPPQLVGVGPELRFVRRLGRRRGNRAGDVAEVVAAGERRGKAQEGGEERWEKGGGGKGQPRHRSPGGGEKPGQRPTRPLPQAADPPRLTPARWSGSARRKWNLPRGRGLRRPG